MGIEWYRDLIICIAGAVTCILILVIIGVTIYLSTIIKSLVKKTRMIMNAVELTTEQFKDIVSEVHQDIVDVKSEILSPLVQIMSIIQGIRKGYELINSFTEKKEAKMSSKDENAGFLVGFIIGAWSSDTLLFHGLD